jgi:CcmD family protein
MTRTIARVLIAMCLVMGGAGLALAQAPALQDQTSPVAQPAPSGAPDQFVPFKSLPAQQQLPAERLVMAAYGFVWAALLVYVWTIWRRLGKVEGEMRDLEARLGGKR